jgi:hypothetical protein
MLDVVSGIPVCMRGNTHGFRLGERGKNPLEVLGVSILSFLCPSVSVYGIQYRGDVTGELE